LHRIAVSLGLSLLGVVGVAVTFPYLFFVIGSRIPFIPTSAWLLLGVLSIVVRVNILCNSVFAIGNDLRHYVEAAVALVLAAGCQLFLGDSLGIYTPIVTSFLPIVLVLNVRPALSALRFLNGRFEHA